MRSTPRVEVPAAKIIAFLFRDRHSHPAENTSAGGTLAWKTREVVAKKVDLPVAVTQELPFSLSVPQDAEPTATAVNSSVCWWVETLIDYGWSGPSNEQARRAVVLYSADGA